MILIDSAFSATNNEHLSWKCDQRSVVARLPAHTVCAGSLNPMNIESACTIVMSTRQWRTQVVYSRRCLLYLLEISRSQMNI